MSGNHNMKIYSFDDNPFCIECKSGEFMKSAYCFKKGAWICWDENGYPNKDGCKGFVQASKGQKKLFKGRFQ